MRIEKRIEEIYGDIPRGITTKFAHQQKAPQARFQDIEKILGSDQLGYNPKKPQGKILLGALGDQLIGFADDRHILSCAGSRAGKSVNLVNNLFFYDGSILANDTKGELANKTAEKRQKLGQDVFILDPFHTTASNLASLRASYNPLVLITLENPFIVEDAGQIASAFIISSSQEKDPHWNESAKKLINGVILYVALSPEIKDENRNLITVRRIIRDIYALEDDQNKDSDYRLPRSAWVAYKLLEEDGHEEIGHIMFSSIKSFYDKPDNERGSVLSTADRHTEFLDNTSMKSVLCGNDFKLQDLKTNPKGVSIYLCLPASRMGHCNRWIRLIFDQFLAAMEREPTKPEVPILACLDEFPVLGFMKQLQDAAGQIASFGVKLWVILQDWGQGTALYGERFESFAANAGVMQFFGNTDLKTTEYISKKLGKTWLEETTAQEMASDKRVSGQSATSVKRTQYPLMEPEEVSRYFARNDRMKRQLITIAGYHPIILQRVEHFDTKGNFAKVFR